MLKSFDISYNSNIKIQTFLFEWKHFIRAPFKILALVLFIVAGIYGLHNGSELYIQQQTAIESKVLGDGKFGLLRLAGNWESHEDDEHADDVLNGERQGQHSDVDPLDGVDLVAEAHVQVHAVEVAEQFAAGAQSHPDDGPLVL